MVTTKNLVERLLANLARRIVRKYNPIVIGITGSVGKTSAREAIFTVVKERFKARKSPKNFNNELGVPLTIIGVETLPEKNLIAWTKIMVRAIGLILWKQKYPELLVLEMGIDHPGDMDFLVGIAKPHIAVITNIGISHYQFFTNVEQIAEEKAKIAGLLTASDFLIVNADNPAAFKKAAQSRGQVISYGIVNEAAKLRPLQTEERYDHRGETDIKIAYNSTEPTRLTIHTLGTPHVYAALAAVAVAQALKLDFSAVSQGLANYKASPGRLNMIEGIRHSLIIDDSYNAVTDSMKEAIALFSHIPAAYKIAVLGDMRELGEKTEEAHREIGTIIGRVKPDELMTVGPNARIYAEEAVKAGMQVGAIHSFLTADEAKFFIEGRVREGTLLLVKGSQNTIRLEKVVLQIMAEPMRAKELLCRQDDVWLKS